MNNIAEKVPDLVHYYKHVVEQKDRDISMDYRQEDEAVVFSNPGNMKRKMKSSIVVNQRKYCKKIESLCKKDETFYRVYFMQGYRLYTLRNYEKLLTLLRRKINSETFEFQEFTDLGSYNKVFQSILDNADSFRYNDQQETGNQSNHDVLDGLGCVGEEGDDCKFNADPQANESILMNMFVLGETKYILLLGHCKETLPQDYALVMKNFVDITSSGVWKASSQKDENPITNILDHTIHTYWQSDGFLPHSIEVKFSKVTSLNNILMFFSNKMDQSYSPYFIKIYGGTHDFDMVLLKSLAIKNVEGWVNLFFYNDCIDNKVYEEENVQAYNSLKSGYIYNPPIDVKIIKFSVFSNQQKGKDSHLRAIRLIQDNNTNEQLLQKSNHYNSFSSRYQVATEGSSTNNKKQQNNKRKLSSHLEGGEEYFTGNSIEYKAANEDTKNDDIKMLSDFHFV